MRRAETRAKRRRERLPNFKAWVFTIARFRVLKAMNAMDRAFLPLSEDVVAKLAAEIPDQASGYDRKLNLLEQCLQKLAPQARRMVEMRYYEALKPAAIAELLGVGVNGVSVLLSRSRVVLRACVEQKLQADSRFGR